jgi:hypothetical protein
MPEPHMRAADHDRAAVAEALGRHMADGRLTVEEYEERVGRAYAARTYGELAELTADLPTPVPAAPPQAAARPVPPGLRGRGAWGPPAHRGVWGSWRFVALIVLAIWLATSVVAGGLIYFWPFWVLVPWGIVLLSHGRGRPRGHRHHGRSRYYC